MFEKFTDRARRVVVLAQEEAQLLGHNYIGSEHLLLALIHDPESAAGDALASVGVSLEAVRRRVVDVVGDGGGSVTGHVPFTSRAKHVLESAVNEATRLGDDYVGTGHLLLSLLRLHDGVAAQIVTEMGTDTKALEQRVSAARTDQREPPQTGAAIPAAAAQELTPAALGVQRIVRAVASLQPLRSYHYLLALFDDPTSVAAKVLASFDIDRATVERRIVAIGIAGTSDALPHE